MTSISEQSQPQVEYRRLGKSGLRVSVPILGTMGFGDPEWWGWPIKEEQALPLLKHAWDRGVNTWDTANVYSNGLSEIIIGKAIKKYNIPRHKLIILTKCFGIVHDSSTSVQTWGDPSFSNSPSYVNQFGLSRAAIFNAVDASLSRLGTDYIDLYQIHRFDPETPVEETMEALHDLVKMGKVRYIGASSMWAWQFQMMNNVAEKRGWTKFVSMQNKHSLMYREEEREMNAYCAHAGIGLIPWGPVESGILCRPLNSEAEKTSARAGATKGSQFEIKLTNADKEIIKRVEKVASETGLSMAQVAMAWSGMKVSSPIIGISSPKRLDEALLGGKKLTEEQCKFLEEPYEPKAIYGHA